MTAGRKTYSPFGNSEADTAWDWRRGRVVGPTEPAVPMSLPRDDGDARAGEPVVAGDASKSGALEPIVEFDFGAVDSLEESDPLAENSDSVEDLWSQDEPDWIPPARILVANVQISAEGPEPGDGLPVPVPRHELDLSARAVMGDVDVKRRSRRRLFRAYVNAALEALGRRDRHARAFAEEMLAGCRNPKARIARVRSLVDAGRTFDEIVLAWQLKEAWRNDLDCGEIMGRYSAEPSIHRAVDVLLGWEDALRILDTFGSIPTLDELAATITTLHDDWVRAWSECFESVRGWYIPVDPPPKYFVQYLVERLHDQHRSMHALRGRE